MMVIISKYFSYEHATPDEFYHLQSQKLKISMFCLGIGDSIQKHTGPGAESPRGMGVWERSPSMKASQGLEKWSSPKIK